MRKVGILGGTFNPMHMGHLILAEWAADFLRLDEVWMLPSGISYQKRHADVLPGKERLHMARLAVEGNSRLRCLDLEIRREGYTYTFETLEELREAHPKARFYFILGADSLLSLERWKHPEKIFQSCALVAAVRNHISPEELKTKREELLKRFGGEIILLPFLDLPFSSSEIRRRVADGQSIRYMVPEGVRNYIEEKGFYREKDRESEEDQKEDPKDTG